MKQLQMKLEPLTPFLAGKRKLGNNLNCSLPYIPGGTIKAAIASHILRQCPYFFDEANDSKRIFWVEFKDDKACQSCAWRQICKEFSNISFGNAYPLAAKPYPLTSMRCKYHKDHESVDMLINDMHRISGRNYVHVQLICPQCHKRMEKCSGFYFVDKTGILKNVSQRRQLIVKGGINYATKTNDDGRLYALEVVVPGGSLIWGGGKESTVNNMEYISVLTVPDDIDVSDFGTSLRLHVGADSHSGLGAMDVHVESFSSKDDMADRIKRFNKAIGYEASTYISLTAMSPLLLGLEDAFADANRPSEMSVENFSYKLQNTFNKYFQEKFGYSLKFIMSFAEYEWYRGFNTSIPVGEKGHLRPAVLQAVIGSVYVFQLPNLTEEILNMLKELEIEGIGFRTEEGYGRVSICDEFHIKNNAEEVLSNDR